MPVWQVDSIEFFCWGAWYKVTILPQLRTHKDIWCYEGKEKENEMSAVVRNQSQDLWLELPEVWLLSYVWTLDSHQQPSLVPRPSSCSVEVSGNETASNLVSFPDPPLAVLKCLGMRLPATLIFCIFYTGGTKQVLLNALVVYLATTQHICYQNSIKSYLKTPFCRSRLLVGRMWSSEICHVRRWSCLDKRSTRRLQPMGQGSLIVCVVRILYAVPNSLYLYMLMKHSTLICYGL